MPISASLATICRNWSTSCRSSGANPDLEQRGAEADHACDGHVSHHREREIAEIIKVEGDAGEYGTNAALSAIRERAPYRPWTKEMVAILGNEPR